MAEPVKVGIVGTGRWAGVLTRASKQSDKVQIVSCYSRTADKREGLTAFLEKRRPDWTGM